MRSFSTVQQLFFQTSLSTEPGGDTNKVEEEDLRASLPPGGSDGSHLRTPDLAVNPQCQLAVSNFFCIFQIHFLCEQFV